MATKFLEPGGDADFGVGLWNSNSGAPTAATDFVHGTHQRSIKYRTNVDDHVGRSACLSDTGSRASVWIYLNALPGAIASVISFRQSNNTTNVVILRLTSAGVLQLWNGTAAQIGSNGPTLSTGQWYRISIAYTITSTSVNRFEVFVNGTSAISVTNATVGNIGTSQFVVGNTSSNNTLDLRSSDHYVDNSNALTDPGNIWVTAKRPVSNGTTNGFTTQIGSGGSGYGTGHSPQVNERPLNTADGWSMIGAGSAITEEYTIEGQSVGDIDITGSTIVDFSGWISAGAAVGETASLILVGAATNAALTSTITIFFAYAGVTTYPGGGTDIGITTTTALTTVSLYECGVLVAFIPTTSTTLSVSESVTATESVTNVVQTSCSVSDSITTTESVSLVVLDRLSVSDSVTTAENLTLAVVTTASVSDTITVAENISERVITNLATNDTVTVSENIAITEITQGAVNVSDSVTVSESVTLIVGTNVSVLNSITVTESVTVTVNSAATLILSVGEDISVTEAVILALTYRVNVSDSITTAEATNIPAPFTPVAGVAGYLNLLFVGR